MRPELCFSVYSQTESLAFLEAKLREAFNTSFKQAPMFSIVFAPDLIINDEMQIVSKKTDKVIADKSAFVKEVNSLFPDKDVQVMSYVRPQNIK